MLARNVTKHWTQMAVVHGPLSVFTALDLGELQEKRLSIRGQFVAFATFVVTFGFMLASTTYVPTAPWTNQIKNQARCSSSSASKTV